MKLKAEGDLESETLLQMKELINEHQFKKWYLLFQFIIFKVN